MLRTLKNRVLSMDAVYSYCIENPLIVALLSSLGLSVTALGVNIKSIRSKEALQEQNTKGVAKDKKVLKENMVKLGSALAQAGQSYAAGINNNTLFDSLNYSETGIYGGAGNTAISKTQGIYTILAAIPLADRTPVGLTDAALDGLKDAIADFSDVLTNTNKVRSNRKNYTKELHEMVNEGSFIMRKRVLTAAKQLRVTYPDFYNNLVNLSKVVNPHTHTKARFEVFSDTTHKAFEGVTVINLQTGESMLTDKKGLCSFYLAFGDYSFEFSHKDFTTKKVEVKVKKGSNTTHVDMAQAFVLPADAVVKEEKVAVEK